MAERPSSRRRRRGWSGCRRTREPLADVLLGVVVDAEREEFHELAAVVLVGGDRGALLEVEVANHQRVEGHGVDERPEVAAPHRPVQLVLLQDEGQSRCLAIVAREEAVPEERHALRELRGRRRHVLVPGADNELIVGGIRHLRQRLGVLVEHHVDQVRVRHRSCGTPIRRRCIRSRHGGGGGPPARPSSRAGWPRLPRRPPLTPLAGTRRATAASDSGSRRRRQRRRRRCRGPGGG